MATSEIAVESCATCGWYDHPDLPPGRQRALSTVIDDAGAVRMCGLCTVPLLVAVETGRIELTLMLTTPPSRRGQ